MSTFLELVQDAAEDSGTFPNVGEPETLDGVSGRMLRMKNWVKRAWRDIQVMERAWHWMDAEMTATLAAGTRTFTPASLFSVSDLARFSTWIPIDRHGMQAFSYWDAATGLQTEQYFIYTDWHEFRWIYGTSTDRALTGWPQRFAIEPDRSLTVYPIPDKEYQLRALYRKSPQMLDQDNDVPEMPSEFHSAIKWRALEYLGLFDENQAQTALWRANFTDILSDLRASQLPETRKAEPLA